MNFRKLNSLLILLAFTSCSILSPSRPVGPISYNWENFSRAPASEVDTSRLETLLGIDKLDYYIVEYINSFGKNIPEQDLAALKSSDFKYLLSKYSDDARIYDAKNYDAIVYEVITDKLGKKPTKAKANYVWGYNFFKNKLNEGFSLLDTKIKVEDKSELTTKLPTKEEALTDLAFSPEDLTLDSGQYISNRTTRAAFWEATESNRGIDFHLENSREFLKNVQENGATILGEVRPFANNYNKIYIVKYPNEATYRYAITSIGGKDRLNHLILQFGLSKLTEKKLKNKIRIFGDVDVSHRMMADELGGIMRHLPKAQRVFIGQKGALEKTLELLWKVRALKNLYEDSPKVVLNEFDAKIKGSFEAFLESQSHNDFDMFKNKKAIEVAFEKLKDSITKKGLLPDSFKQYDYDNFVISMSDISFKNIDGQETVWRVVANSWGDEIAPLAQALKDTGHKDITYIGTAGAFPGKGHKVGDLVIPTHARINGINVKLNGDILTVDGAKNTGVVDHVFSPFEETKQWLEESKVHSDYVEVETSHLREILNSPSDHMRAYLLISDVLGSEGETLASATSAKRRNALNKLLVSILERDRVGIPSNVEKNLESFALLRNLVDKALVGKGNTFKYYVYSALKDANIQDVAEVTNFASSVDSFTDAYFTKRIVEASEISSFVARKLESTGIMPQLSVSKDFVSGNWHPKKDKIYVTFHAPSDTALEAYKEAMEELQSEIDKIASFCEINLTRGPPSNNEVTIPKYVAGDSDFLINVYSQSAFKQAGLDAQVTYNGNIKFNFLPTTSTSEVCDANKFCHLAFFEPDNTTKGLLDEVNTSSKFLNLSGINIEQTFESKIKSLSNALIARGEQEDFKTVLEVEKNAILADGKLAEIVPEFKEGKGLVIKVRFTKEGFKNPVVVLEELMHLGQITSNYGYFKHPVFWAEMALNTQYGSKRSKLFMAKAEIDAMDELFIYISANGTMDSKIANYIEARKAHASNLVMSIAKEEKAEAKMRKGINARWSSLITKLEAEKLKLDDYIAANNRKKVVEIVEAYMPWEEMEPTEIAAWTRWLEAIENPSTNKKDYMITFRGIADDLVRESNDGGHFLMSKLLTKNQGNYNRRLRSFKTFFNKRLSQKAKNEIPVDVQSLAAIFKGHSHDPVGSPFLSTSVLDIASSFSGHPSRIAAMKMDKRRNLVNLVSHYGELEQMVPLIVFPDEIIKLEETNDFAQFRKDVEAKLGRKLTDAEFSRDVENVKMDATREWWNMVNPEGIVPENSYKTCKDVIKLFMGI